MHQQASNDGDLYVRELASDSNLYRWYHCDDNAIQSLIDVNAPEQLLMPVYQSMLLFLLWQKAINVSGNVSSDISNKRSNIRVANLGMGAGGIERALADIPDIELYSVEQNADVIDIARQHFFLPVEQVVHLESAEHFLNYFGKSEDQGNNNIDDKSNSDVKDCYDIILVDIFIGMQGEQYLTDIDFYQALKNKLASRSSHSVDDEITGCRGVFFNISVNSAAQLIDIIHCIHQVFSHSALIDFENFKNIVLYMSDDVIPTQSQLLQMNQQYSEKQSEEKQNLACELAYPIDFSDTISRMRIIK